MIASMSGTHRSVDTQTPLFAPSLPPRAEMERAFLGSDASYDGIFFTGVRTTGIFCRPSCRARKPLPRERRVLRARVRDALFAGYRPVPALPAARAGRRRARLGDAAARRGRGTDPNRRLRDSDLRAFGVDPARARRYFLEHYGMTFHAYCRGRRLAGALRQLREGEALDDVALGTG